MKHIIVGTAGHIDHGKSALVEALTGTNPDRLEEEKRRGITIDLGFAFLEMQDVRFGFVDVPGHERFVRNMLAGAGGFDLVLLVIAADEGIMPQTREHFDICRLLGIPRGIVVLTKSDLVEPDVLGLVRLEVEEFLRGSFLEGAPTVSVSARTGAGLEALKQELLRVANDVPPRDASRHVRLPIDRVFAIKGFGTVVTGTLISGSVKPEDEVELHPGGRRLRVRGVQSGGRQVEQAVAGQRTAVNLAGVDVNEIERGMTLGAPGVFVTTRRLDAQVTLLPSARKLKQRAHVHFHQGTVETVARAILLGQEDLPPGKSAFAQLELDDDVLVLPGDRFILRQFSPVVTIGGGTVLDNLATRHRTNNARVVPFLEVVARGNREEILAALAGAEPEGLALPRIIARTGWTEAEVQFTAQALVKAAKLEVIGEAPLVVALRSAREQLAAQVAGAIERFHSANPLAPGITREELRARVQEGRGGDQLLHAALQALAAERKIEVAGELVKRAGWGVALQPEEAKAREQIEAAFAKAGLAVPAVGEVLAKLPVDAKRAQKILQLLLREQVLVKVTEELLFHRDALTRLRELLAGYKKQNGTRISVPAFKELTGITRKYAIPLLEYLDRNRVTRRVGDAREIL